MGISALARPTVGNPTAGGVCGTVYLAGAQSALRSYLGMVLCSARGLTLLLWRAQGYAARFLVILPVSGWPCSPTPWPAPPAYALAALAYLVRSIPLLVILASQVSDYSSFKVAVIASWTLAASLETWERVFRRHELCDFVNSVRLYSRASGPHPLSAAGWRRVLLVTLASCVYSAVCYDTGTWWHKEPYQSWRMGASLGESAVVVGLTLVNVKQALYTGLLLILAVGPQTMLAALASDLRRDCDHLIAANSLLVPVFAPRRQQQQQQQQQQCRSHSASCRSCCRRPPAPARPATLVAQDRKLAAERWRALRVRQQLLCDIGRQVNASFRWQILIHIVFIFGFASIGYSTSLSFFVNQHHIGWWEIRPLVGAIARNLCFVLICISYSWMTSEFTKISEALQGHLSSQRLLPRNVIREIDAFVNQIQRNDGRFDLFGFFFVDMDFMKTVQAAISSYLVIIFQLKLTF